jgi:hypothetical protein
VWLTDLEHPTRLNLGFVGVLNKCDRLEWRFEVETNRAVPWPRWAHANGVPAEIRDGLEGVPQARPLNWWVCEEEMDVVAIKHNVSAFRPPS